MASRKGAAHASNVMGALVEATRPLSAYDLLDKLRPTGVAAPLTVYRALQRLIESGKVHRIESLNAFVACRSGDHHHDHVQGSDSATSCRAVGFAICDRCGAVDEFVDAKLFGKIGKALTKKQFTPHATAVEVHGLCAPCSTAEPGAGSGHRLAKAD